MSSSGKHWHHITLSTYGSWLPGDPRGFRSKDHRIHSSGDHRHPPPPGEHAVLHRWAKSHTGPTVLLPRALRPTIGRSLHHHAQRLGHRVLVIGVTAKHVHLLVELPVDRAAVKHEVGRCKRVASLAVTEVLPGRVWARLPGIRPIADYEHQANAFNYIREHVDEGGWVWTYREGELPFDVNAADP